MSIAAKLAERLADEAFQDAFAARLLEPVTEGGRYADLLKLYELVAALPDPEDGRPLRAYSDAALYAILRDISAAEPDADSGQRATGRERLVPLGVAASGAAPENELTV